MLKKILKSLVILILTALTSVFLINLYINFYSADKIFTLEESPPSKVGILLGAGVLSNQTLSDILKDRALTAIELWEKGKIEKILVSGDNSSMYYNEVVPVQKFLIEKGIPTEVIFLDYAGFDTYDSVYRAKHIFLVKEAVVITQKFHLPRAVYLCSKVGINCNGVIADKQTYVKADYFAQREILAKVKAFLNILFYSQPKFLGKVIDMEA